MPQLGLSPIEEAFFRAGDDMSYELGLEDIERRVTLWQAVVGWLRGAAIGRTATSEF